MVNEYDWTGYVRVIIAMLVMWPLALFVVLGYAHYARKGDTRTLRDAGLTPPEEL